MTTDLEAGQIEALRQGLRSLLESGPLEPHLEKLVRKLLRLIEDETGIPDHVAEGIQKMLASRVQTPEQAAMRLSQKIREHAGRRRPPLGRPAGRGAPREKSEDPHLHEAAKELMEKIRQAAERRRRGGV